MKKIVYSFLVVAFAVICGTGIAQAEVTPKVITNADGEVYMITNKLLQEYYEAGWVTNGDGAAVSSGSYSSKNGGNNTNYIDPVTEQSGEKKAATGIVIKTAANRSARFYFTGAVKVASFIGITGNNRVATMKIYTLDNVEVASVSTSPDNLNGAYEMITIDNLDNTKSYYAKVTSDGDNCWYAIKFWASSRTIDTVETIITGVDIDDEAISSANLATLLSDKTVSIDKSYIVAPTVVFNTQTTTTYTEGDPDVKTGSVEAEVAEVDGTFVATAEVGGEEYTVIVNKSTEATLEVTPAAVTLNSITVGTGTATINVVGANLTGEAVTITLPDVAGLTCDKATLPIENGSVNGTITLTYKSVEDVAEAIVNVSLAAGETTATIAVTYSSTAVVTEIVPVTEATVWDWATAVNDKDKDINPISSQYGEYFANYEGWKNTFNAAALKGTGSSFYRSGYECFQGKSLTFNAGVSGKLTVVYSNTSKDSSNGVRDLYVNGVATNTAVYKANGKDENEKITASLYVSAGLVALSAKQIIDKNGNTIDAPTDADLRIYSITFTPMVSVTVGNTGYSTLYYSNASLTVPEGISGWTFTASGEGLAAYETYPAGSVIPADVAVVLYTKTPGDYEFAAVAGTAGTLPAANLLKGTDEAEEVTTDGTPYILASGSNGIGFYQAAPEGGKTFTNGAHKAYLETPASMPKAPAFILNLGGTTGAQIITVDNEAAEGATYNVLGQKVGNNYKGFVVKNGQKTINK